MVRWKYLAGLVLAGVIPCGAAASAAEEEPREQAASAQAQQVKAPPDQEIARLVERLDARRYADRQAASQQLRAIGRPAIAAISKAATGESLEATIRAVDLLRDFLDSPDAATQQSAREALESIAKSNRPAAARRAQEMLDARQTPPLVPGMVPGGIIQGGQIQIGFAGGARRMSVRNINGVKEIEVDENDQKVKIRDDPQKGVSVEVTKKKAGQNVTERFEAPSAEELKKKHPEAHKLYAQYAQNQAFGGMFQVQIQAAGGAAVPGPALQPVPPAQVAGQQLESAARMLKAWGRHLELLTREEQFKNAPQASKDSLEKQVEEFKQQLADLEKRLKVKTEPPKPAGKPGP